MPRSGKLLPSILRRPLGVATLLAAVAALFAAACAGGDAAQPLGPTPTPVPDPVIDLPTLPTPSGNIVVAEFGPYPGEVGSKGSNFVEQDPAYWINTDPLTIDGLQGEVVLVDFWTYTCVNCIRTLPYLRDWHEKYGDIGLTIVGVHTPEFEFERLRENVEEAVAEFDIGWPVVQDNAYATWQAYHNQFWPAKYLLDKDGIIRFTHFGEGAYLETEAEIRNLLLDAGVSLAGIPTGTDAGPEFDPRALVNDYDTGQTRELYAGLRPQFLARIPYLLQPEIYSATPGDPVTFEDPGEHQNHYLYFHGQWIPEQESARHARETEDLEDYVALRFNAKSVNAVMEIDEESYRVYVTLDGQPVPEADWGLDMQQDEEGGTYILVDKDRMYRIIESSEYSTHELKLSSNSDQFTLFAFTFGSYPSGP
ncbi:MAG: redoxin family protein [Chloroflexota bacterium]|nr:redoxin family protein [Chloroflexota bacterium]